jgi:hypothetical protein
MQVSLLIYFARSLYDEMYSFPATVSAKSPFPRFLFMDNRVNNTMNCDSINKDQKVPPASHLCDC